MTLETVNKTPKTREPELTKQIIKILMMLLDILLIFELSVIYVKLNELLDANKLTMAILPIRTC